MDQTIGERSRRFQKFRDRRRPDGTSANPPWSQASRTRRCEENAAPDGAATAGAGRRESREGVKREWARI